MLTTVIYNNCDVAFSPENRWANFFWQLLMQMRVSTDPYHDGMDP